MTKRVVHAICHQILTVFWLKYLETLTMGRKYTCDGNLAHFYRKWKPYLYIDDGAIPCVLMDDSITLAWQAKPRALITDYRSLKVYH